jgi:AAA domain
MSAYPEGFDAWPLDERNAYFADAARSYDEKARPSLRLASTSEPPPQAPLDQMPDGYAGPDSGAVKVQTARFTLEDWNDIDFDPNEEWRVEDILPMRGFGLIYGKPRSFKSFIAMNLALHVVLGLTWAGKLVEKGKVVYIAAEGAAGMRKRVASYQARHKVPRGDFALLSAAPNLGIGDGDLPALVAAVESSGFKPDLIVVDTASKSIGAAEENGAGMAAFVGNAEKLARHFDCLVLAVHHVGLGEDAQKRPRGWSGLGGALDVQILCERPGDEKRTTLTVQKLKDEEDGVGFEARLSRVVVGHDKRGKEASTLIVDEVVQTNAPAAKEATVRRIPESRRLLMDVVAMALDEKGADHRPFGMQGPKVRAVADSHIRDLYFSRVAEKAAPAEDEATLYQRRFKAFNRSLKAAIDAKTLIAGDHERGRIIWQP